MSRNLYMLAVVSAAAEDEIQDSIGHLPSDVRPAAVMQRVAAMLDEVQPRIAFYQVLLDGWGRAHERCLTHWNDRKAAAECMRQLEETGVAWLQPDEINDAESVDAAAHRSASPGAYATHAFSNALGNWLAFMRSTRCAGVLAWRCVGPTLDDHEFKSH
jgi:hypothetical protein